MSEEASAAREWRAHELIGSVPIALFAVFHLWEQWPAFAGRDAWLARMAGTSHGALALVVEIAVLLCALAWIALEARLRVRRSEPEALRLAMAEDPEVARRLGLLARACSWIFFGWLLLHAGWLWLPKLTRGAEPMLAWTAMRDGMGTWPLATAHALGLVAMTVHLWAAAPRLAVALGWVASPEGRRAARLSGLIVALGLAILYAQLAGWHAAGRGTLWSL